MSRNLPLGNILPKYHTLDLGERTFSYYYNYLHLCNVENVNYLSILLHDSDQSVWRKYKYKYEVKAFNAFIFEML